MIRREDIKSPYWIADRDLPGYDFNRELVEPFTNEMFPKGAVGVRVDGDYWAVAALPWSCHEYKIEEIVKALWPTRYDEATFGTDSKA